MSVATRVINLHNQLETKIDDDIRNGRLNDYFEACIFLFCIVSFTELAIILPLSIFIGLGTSFALVSITIAPILEEYLKRIAVNKGFPFLFAFVFSVIEFVGYGMLFIWMIDIFLFVKLRLFATLMHFSTVTAMFLFKSSRTKKVTNAGYILAVIIHFAYNLGMALM